MFILPHLCRRKNQLVRMVNLVFFLRSCTRLSSSSLSLALHRRRHPLLLMLQMVAHQVHALCNLLRTHRQQMLIACTQSRHPPLLRRRLPRLLLLRAVTQQLHVDRDMPLQMHLMARTQSRHPPLVRRRLHRLEPTSAKSLKKRSPHQSERRWNGATAAGTRCRDGGVLQERLQISAEIWR